MSIAEARAFKVVFGVIGNDIHVVANRILDEVLRAADVVGCNLGTNNRVEDFVAAAREVGADAVLVSSLNGEAETWCRDFGAAFGAAGLARVKLYIGGNLAIGDASAAAVEARFRAYGFDRVFHRAGDLDAVVSLLLEDLGHGMAG